MQIGADDCRLGPLCSQATSRPRFVFDPQRRDHGPMNTSDEYPDLNAFREKPCGRKAEWIVIGDVLDGGADFVVTCRECYQKGLGRYSLSTNDDLIPAGIFKDDFGRDPMCGDEDLGLSFAIEEATKEVADGPQSRPGFVRWVKRRDIEARFHRVAIHRRFQRIESSVAILSSIASIAVAIYAANASKKWLPWGEWSW